MVAERKRSCGGCGAYVVRADEEGRLYCWVCWWRYVLDEWQAGCADAWHARQVLETMLRAARPVAPARIAELVAYHPLRHLEPGERALRFAHLQAAMQTALDDLERAGVLARYADGYWWEAGSYERLHGETARCENRTFRAQDGSAPGPGA